MAGLAKLQLLIDIKEKLNVGLNKAKQKVDRAVGGMQKKLNSISINSTKAFGAIKDQIPGLAGSLGMLANPYGLIAAAVLALGTALVSCTAKAIEWHDSLAAINVTAELAPDKLDKLSDKLLEIGGRNVAPLEEVPKAFNKIISAGLSVNDSLATLEPTLRAAKAGFVDVETAAAAATSVMMAAGVDATKTFDVLFATQKAGNAEFKDIANYLPKVIPLARNVGLALEETAGAYASLTGSLKPEAASTALEGMMRSLSNANVVKNFKGLGIEIFDKETGKAKPIIDILTQMDSKMKGLNDKQRMLKFDKLGLDQSAMLGFSTLMQNLPKVQSDIDAVVNSQGAANKAYEDAKQPLDSWKIIMNQVKVAMIKIGEIFMPMVSAVGEKVLGIIQYWKDLYRDSLMFRDIISGIGTVFSAVWNIASAGFNLVINLIKNVYDNVVGLIKKWLNMGAVIMGFKGGFTELYNTVRPVLIWIKEALSEIGSLLYSFVTFDIDGIKSKIQNFKLPDLSEIKQRVIVAPGDDNGDGDFSDVPGSDTPVVTPAATNNDTTISDGAKGIKGNSQTKNITINIDSFIKGFSPTHQSFNNMSMDELERKMTEVFMRVVRSAETSM